LPHFAPLVNSFAPLSSRRVPLGHPIRSGYRSSPRHTRRMNPLVLVGVGEMGGTFAKAFLRRGVPVYPALRSSDLDALAARLPEPSLVLVTVGETDLHATLASLPGPWRDRVGLIQNELLPRDWRAHAIVDPTVAAVWFEKKPGQDVKVLTPTPVAGPGAPAVVDALQSIGIDAVRIADADLLQALVVKNVYILVSNIAGLKTGGTVDELWRIHNDLAMGTAKEILEIQQWLSATEFDREAVIERVLAGVEGDPDHRATGRSAPARLVRAIDHADEAGLPVPILRSIGRDEGLIA